MIINKQSFIYYLSKDMAITRIFAKTISAIVILYLYALASSRFLPEGINSVFVTNVCKRLFIPVAMSCFLFFIYCVTQWSFKYLRSSEKFNIKDLLLLLLPMTPIVRYIILNQDILSALDSGAIFVIFSTLSFGLIFLIPAVFGMIGSKKMAMIAGLSFSYTIYNMAALASDLRWHLSGNFKIQSMALAVFFTIVLIIYLMDRKFLNRAILLFFVLGIITSLISSEQIKGQIKKVLYTIDKPKIYAYTEGKKIIRKPDIFLLTYDSYVENETMLKYGIDNKAQEDYLAQNGFHVYKGTYSVDVPTKESMGRVLDVSDTEFIPRQSWQSLIIGSEAINFSSTAVSGSGAVQRILKENGYETFGIFGWDYFFQKVGSSYDHSFPLHSGSSVKLLTRSIFEGEFRFDADFYTTKYDEYLLEKRKALASKKDKPRFLYAHSWYPGHSQKSGKAIDNEINFFKERLIRANEEMTGDIEAIKENAPNAIIIVNGDHGPNLIKKGAYTGRNKSYSKSETDRLDIQDQFGSFLAIKWPEGANIDHSNIRILQDIFPMVFSYLYDDPAVLNSRIGQLTVDTKNIGGVRVRSGVIVGGKDDGKLLFDAMLEKLTDT